MESGYTHINVLNAAKIVLVHAKVNGIPMSHLKLQKVLYYMQAWHATYFKDGLYENGVLPEAWVNGPVYRQVYHQYKTNGSDDLTSTVEGDAEAGIDGTLTELRLNDNQKKLLIEVLEAYSILPPERLVGLTHREKPWRAAREGYEAFDNCSEKISLQSMIDCYSKRLEKT